MIRCGQSSGTHVHLSREGILSRCILHVRHATWVIVGGVLHTRTLLKMDVLRHNFYRVVASSEWTYMKNSSVGIFVDEQHFFLYLQPCLLSMRDGRTFHVEPYFPHRFTRQFEYDQGVPECLAMISHKAQEISVGSSSRYTLCSRFREPPNQQLYAFKPWDMSLPYYHCSDRGREVMMEAELGIKMTSPAHILWIDLFRDPETFAGRIHHIIGWLGVSEHRLLFYDPLVEEEEFQMREPAAQSRAPSTWSGDDDTIQAEEVIFAEDGYRFRPLTGIARESALPLASCHRATILDLSEDERAPESPIDLSDSSEEAPLEGDGEAGPGRSHTHGFDEVADEATPAIDIVEEAVVAPMSPIRSAGGGGSAGSVDETPGVLKDVGCRSPIVSMGSGGEVSVATGRTSAALISESVSIVPVAHSPGSFSHIGLPLPRGGGIDDLNVDNNHRPLGLLGADAPILSSSFYLVSPGRAERSPSSVHQAGSSHEGGPAHRRVSFPDGGTDVVSGRAVEPIAPVEGGAIEAVVPDNDKGSGGNSSTGQHVPTGSDHHIAVGGAPPTFSPFFFYWFLT
ncbi:hypothetical protein ACLOJK_036717 [Asimina triloba]